MQHIENISELFSRDFVENPMIESFEVGVISLVSGRLVACDPLITNDMKPFKVSFPKGDFTVIVHKERETGCIAYVEIIFGKETVTHWEMAITDGQNIADLNDNEIFGYPVQSGMGCFMDVDTQDKLNLLEREIYNKKGDLFMGIYEEFFHQYFSGGEQYAFLNPDESNTGNIFAFEAGFGEGFYASYIGFNAESKPVKIITEFIEVAG